MKKTKKAVGYVCDIPIPNTDLVISKEDQRARILKYAQQENIELITIFDDEVFTEDPSYRPGLQKLLNCKECFEMVLVERAWCITRRMKDLKSFIERLDAKNAELVTSSYLWDCVSQHVRHHYRVEAKRREAVAKTVREAA